MRYYLYWATPGLALVSGPVGRIFPSPNLPRAQTTVENSHCYSKHCTLEMWTPGLLVIQQVRGKGGRMCWWSLLLFCIKFMMSSEASAQKGMKWRSLLLLLILYIYIFSMFHKSALNKTKLITYNMKIKQIMIIGFTVSLLILVHNY